MIHERLRHKCELCEKDFSDKFNLLNHQTVVHEGGESLKNPKNQEIITTSDGKTQFMCKLCKGFFNAKENLENHMVIFHVAKARPYNRLDNTYL